MFVDLEFHFKKYMEHILKCFKKEIIILSLYVLLGLKFSLFCTPLNYLMSK